MKEIKDIIHAKLEALRSYKPINRNISFAVTHAHARAVQLL